MFFIINTSEKRNPYFQCDSRINFIELNSKKYNLENFQGKVVFDLDLVDSDSEQEKIKTILNSISFNWLFDESNKDLTSIIREQQSFLSNVCLSGLYSKELTKSYINTKILEMTYSKPYSLSYKEPAFNAQGFYIEKV